MDTFAAGQQWTFDTPPGFEDARLVIGAVLRFDNREPIVCCSVLRAPRRTPDGHVEPVDIPFIPFAAPALAGSVRSRDGDGTPAEGFAAAFAAVITVGNISMPLLITTGAVQA